VAFLEIVWPGLALIIGLVALSPDQEDVKTIMLIKQNQ